MSSLSPQVHKSPSTIYDNDECNNSILAQTSSVPLPQPVDHSSEDESCFDILVPQASPTSPQLHTHGDRCSQNKETAQDSKPGISIASDTIDHPSMDTGKEDHHSISTPMPLITAEPPCIDCGSGDVQSREAGQDVDPGVLTPMEAPHIAIEPCSAVRRGGDTGGAEVTSITLFQESSNVHIKDTNIIATGGNATFIQFGDGQFTEIQRNLICDYIANLTVLPDIDHNLKKHILTQSITSLPRAEAVFSDYQTKKKSGPCFEGTRVALLREMADWVTSLDNSKMHVLSGLAGIGKSTVAYTIASRASDVNLLGASFFFSRDEDDRKNAKKFFTTIAYQLCVYNEAFAKAIGDVLMTERGSVATTKDPQEQLQVLILEPLRTIVQPWTRPILVVVDALDECDEDDEHAVFKGLCQLVRDLPPFKVILTTRPQSHLDRFLSNQGGHKLLYLHDIEDKIVDGDIRLYLKYSLSLEQTQERYPRRQWYASDKEIDHLVHASGRLFIIASTAVRYILDKSASNPAGQMQKLLNAFVQDHTPFDELDRFYTVILRNVIPENCCNHSALSRYRSVVGTIIFVQRPLSVSALAHVMKIDVVEIREVLDDLQSVILVGNDDVPRIYHKSFPDYVTNQARCKDPRLQIDAGILFTQIVTRCFEIMNKYLKNNILGLGNPARFMKNEEGVKEDGVTDEQLEEKIPQQLRYACVYWDNHLKAANLEDVDFMKVLEKFVNEHMLHWLEVLSLIGKLDSAHGAINAVLKLVKSRSSDLRQLLSDALRFISKFYEIIKRSALHTYYSALAFTPTDSLLYRRYNKETVYNTCVISGGPEKWDAFVNDMGHEGDVAVIKFSLDSSLLVSCSEEYVSKDKDMCKRGKLKIWDATTGTHISVIPGRRFAIANDFSTVASSEDITISCYNVNGSTRGAMFTTASTIKRLALSSESNRIAAALDDGTVLLWESRNSEFIDSFKDFESNEYVGSSFLQATFPYLQFSATGTRFAYSSLNDNIKLRDGISGRFIADLQCGPYPKFEFSGDGSRIASLSDDRHLKLWNSQSGALIDGVKDSGRNDLAISENGSLLATADSANVRLWSENRGRLAQIKVLELDFLLGPITLSMNNILAIATESHIKLYDVKTRSFISTFPFNGVPKRLAFSPDCTRLAGADYMNTVYLWDIRDMDASGPPSKENAAAVTALTLSRDCSRLACGFADGAVELWGIDPTTGTKQRLRSKIKAFLPRILGQFCHKGIVSTFGISPDRKLLASGSEDKTIKLWNGENGSLRGTLKVPGEFLDVALSNSVLVAGWNTLSSEDTWISGVTLWNLDTLSPIHTFKGLERAVFKVSITENSALIAIADHNGHVSLVDVVNKTIVTTFDVPYKLSLMTFLPNNSHLVIQSDEGVILSLNLIDKHIIEPTFKHLIQLPDTLLWLGLPIWHCKDKEQHCFSALFPRHTKPVPILWVPKQMSVMALTQRSSMIALSCNDDGRVIFLLPTSHDIN